METRESVIDKILYMNVSEASGAERARRLAVLIIIIIITTIIGPGPRAEEGRTRQVQASPIAAQREGKFNALAPIAAVHVSLNKSNNTWNRKCFTARQLG